MKSPEACSGNLTSMGTATVLAWQSAQKVWSWQAAQPSLDERAIGPCWRTKFPWCENSETGRRGNFRRSTWHGLQVPAASSTACSWHPVQVLMGGTVDSP